MQFKAWLGAAADLAAQHQHRRAEEPIQRHLVHAVQRHVEHPRQPAFQHHTARQITHQVTHRGKARQRDQRAVVGVLVGRQLFAFNPQLERFGQQ